METALLAAISGEAVILVIVQLVIAGLIYWVVDWGLKKIEPPEPIGKIVTVLLVLLLVLFVVNALLTLAGHPIVRW